MAKKEAKPIVEYQIVDGQEKIVQVFESGAAVYRFYLTTDPPVKMWTSWITLACQKKIKWVKGRYFRFATPEEAATLRHALARIERLEQPEQPEPEEKITPNYDDWLPEPEGEIDIIPAVTEKPTQQDGLSEFERMLQKMSRE